MKIEYLSSPEFSWWDDYVMKNSLGTFYHLSGWKDIIEKSFHHQTYYLAAMEGNEVVGILPIVYLRSLIFGKILCSLPYLNFAGVISDSAESEKLLVDEAKKIFHMNQVNYMEYRQFQKVFSLNHTQDHKVSMTIKLEGDPEKLWNNFNTKHRNELRKGLKQPLVIRRGTTELLQDFYLMISRGWRDLGTPLYALSFFKNIVDFFPNNIEIYVIYKDSKPVAAAFNGFLKETVEGMWTYALPEYRNLNVNYLLYWEMIRQACLRGFSYFHLGRSTKDSGAEFFKKKWNAFPQQLYWQYLLPEKAQPPQLNVENPQYRLYINLWKRLPVWLTRIIGPPIAKNIP